MSIRKRESKKAKNGYIYEVYFDYKKQGIKERYSRSGFATKKEAQEHESLMKSELIETGKIRKISKRTLTDEYNDFIHFGNSGYDINTIQHTIDYYKPCKESLGNLPIVEIDYSVLQKFFNSRKDKGIESNKCIRKALFRILNHAIKNGDIKENPIRLVDVTGIEIHKNTPKILEEDTFIKIVTELWNNNDFNKKSYAVAIVVGYYTGTRICEACGLLKNNFDFDNDLLYIGSELVYKGLRKKDYFIKTTLKTPTSKDYLPLIPELKVLLLEWFELNPYDYVICDENGTLINPDLINHAAKRIAKKYNKHFNFHMLRHTFSTNIVLGGVDIKVAQELMRHSNINTTISTYTHINNQHKKDAVDKIFNSKSVEKVSKTIFSQNQVN